jgi:hypothetical protein
LSTDSLDLLLRSPRYETVKQTYGTPFQEKLEFYNVIVGEDEQGITITSEFVRIPVATSEEEKFYWTTMCVAPKGAYSEYSASLIRVTFCCNHRLDARSEDQELDGKDSIVVSKDGYINLYLYFRPEHFAGFRQIDWKNEYLDLRIHADETFRNHRFPISEAEKDWHRGRIEKPPLNDDVPGSVKVPIARYMTFTFDISKHPQEKAKDSSMLVKLFRFYRLLSGK